MTENVHLRYGAAHRRMRREWSRRFERDRLAKQLRLLEREVAKDPEKWKAEVEAVQASIDRLEA